MDDSFPSSNPFRRRTTADSMGQQQLQPKDAQARPGLSQYRSSSKKIVRVASPPSALIEPDRSVKDRPRTPLPPSARQRPGTPPPKDIESSSSDDDEENGPIQLQTDKDLEYSNDFLGNSSSLPSEQNAAPAMSGTPGNPFRKSQGLNDADLAEAKRPDVRSGGNSMDVDAFKRLIMTGATKKDAEDSGPAARDDRDDSPRTSRSVTNEAGPQETRPDESPVIQGSAKRKPPPPKTRHGRPLGSLEHNDDSGSINEPPANAGNEIEVATAASKALSTTTALENAGPSQSGSRENIDPHQPSPDTFQLSTSPPRKQPPTPPLARRQSHRVAFSPTLSRSNSSRSFRTQEEQRRTGLGVEEAKLTEGRGAPPPPPPARRTTFEGSSNTPQLSSDDSSSIVVTSNLQFPGTASSSSSIRSHRLSNSTPSEDALPGPPRPPPPRRHRGSSKGSLDNGSSTALARPARSSRELDRSHVPQLPPTSVPQETESAVTEVSGSSVSSAPKDKDLLADISALQREVDELRDRYEHKGGSAYQSRRP